MNKEKQEGLSAFFFKFVPGDTKEELKERIIKVKETGVHNILASYEAKGLKETKFDEKYFQTLPEIAEACKELDMTFWLEDYSPFPTGSANGAFKEPENAHLNKLYIDERHMDLRGPLKEAVIRIDAIQNVVYGKAMHRFVKMDPSCRKRLGVVAYRIREHGDLANNLTLEDGTGIVLDSYIENGYLKWEIPDGYWRVFVMFTTYESSGRPNYMNLLSKESVALEIEQIHKPIYECLKEYIGESWNGFFYDEPEIGNSGGANVFDYFMLPGRRSKAKADCDVYPWSLEMRGELEKRDSEWLKKLPYLWYRAEEEHKRQWLDYMDAVTSLVRENYNGQVYSFCQDKGIRYIGHVLEDEGSHTRLGCGPGHYFRQQYYQDEAGIDVIAGQILPGRDGAVSWYGAVNADGEFYHYGLAKLASSEAHINSLKKNHSVCETFAMYGQQGMAEKKFLVDHLLVNGINRILFGDLTSYAAPQEYAKMLAEYTDKMCGLLRNSVAVRKAAVLYHAESEWMDADNAQQFQIPAGELARNQISYDVIPADVFAFPERYRTETEDGLTVNGNRYEILVIPGCASLAPTVGQFVRQCAETGFPVLFTDCMPENLKSENQEKTCCKEVRLQNLAEECGTYINRDIKVESAEKRWIRQEHLRRNETDIFLLHNESPRGDAACDIFLNTKKTVVQADPVSGLCRLPKQEKQPNGTIKVHLDLGHFEMTVLYTDNANDGQICSLQKLCPHKTDWRVTLPDGRSVTGAEGKLPDLKEVLEPEFYGKLIYHTEWNQEESLPKVLSLGRVSDCCEVTLNGKALGKRIAAPYIYDVRDTVIAGKNELTIEVYTSAANFPNELTVFGVPLNSLTAYPYTPVERCGIQGDIFWLE